MFVHRPSLQTHAERTSQQPLQLLAAHLHLPGECLVVCGCGCGRPRTQQVWITGVYCSSKNFKKTQIYFNFINLSLLQTFILYFENATAFIFIAPLGIITLYI